MTKPLETSALAAFTEEFRESLPLIVGALDTVARDRSDPLAAHEAYRLIHALKGAASMVGLAAFGYLLNAAEEQIEAAVAASTPLTDDMVASLRGSVPHFARYLDSALAGDPVEPVALDLARVLRLGGAADITSLRELIEIEAREVALFAPEPVHVLDDGAAETGLQLEVWAETEPTIEMRSPVPAPPYVELPYEDSLGEFLDRELIQAVEDMTDPLLAMLDGVPATAVEFDVLRDGEVPPEVAEVFAEEATEYLETIARLTSRLSAVPEDREPIRELCRVVHTLKGAAGVVGYRGASKLAHRMEDLLDRLHEATALVTPDEARLLASSSDVLQDLIHGTADAAALGAAVIRLFAEFDALVGGAPVSASPDAMAAWMTGESAALPRAGGEAAGDKQPAPDRQAIPMSPPTVERRRRIADRRSSGALLRVPLKRLNELVRVVSELVINRSTFEQHHLALIDEVDELKLSTARLRRVTHRLESDYEVRALGGHMTMVGPGSGRATRSSDRHGFDELELDRYTDFHLLTRELAETASDIATIGDRVAGTIADFDGDLTRLGRLTREVQDRAMEFRMVPLGTLAAQLDRAVRSTGESCGKLVELAIEGEHVALDKSLLEQMADPLLHLLRNAVDHGIEAPEGRLASGKRERGQITVRAFHEGTDVLIEVQDDGAGLDVERIRQTAIAQGLVDEAAAASMTDDAVYGFIFEAGFSTARRVSEISGRGIGMDVVKSMVGRLNGRVYVTSEAGTGTTISVRVPMTLAITRVLLVRAGDETYGLPLGAVVQIVRPHPTAIALVGAKRTFTVDGRTYPLLDLAETLGLPRAAVTPAVQPVLIANLSRRRVALAVDEIVNSRDVVVKTLGTHLRRVPGIWGATLLGDGTVVLILNAADVAGSGGESVLVRPPAPRPIAGSARAPYTVLIVDDSLSMRHVLSVAVKKAGWTAVPARDGLEALEIVRRRMPPPDIVLLDIEMPRMDGFEFLSTVRAQKANADLPIVMLTSRGGDKHRDRAKALGATDYMVKPFQEEALLNNIDRLVKASRESDRRVAS